MSRVACISATACLVTLVLGLLLKLVGVATPWWRMASEQEFSGCEGLWQKCSDKGEFQTKSEFSNRKTALWGVIQVLEVLALFFMTCAFFSFACAIACCGKKKRAGRMCSASSVTSLAGGTVGAVGDLLYVYVVTKQGDHLPTEHLYALSFALSVAGTLFSFIAAIAVCSSTHVFNPKGKHSTSKHPLFRFIPDSSQLYSIRPWHWDKNSLPYNSSYPGQFHVNSQGWAHESSKGKGVHAMRQTPKFESSLRKPRTSAWEEQVTSFSTRHVPYQTSEEPPSRYPMELVPQQPYFKGPRLNETFAKSGEPRQHQRDSEPRSEDHYRLIRKERHHGDIRRARSEESVQPGSRNPKQSQIIRQTRSADNIYDARQLRYHHDIREMGHQRSHSATELRSEECHPEVAGPEHHRYVGNPSEEHHQSVRAPVSDHHPVTAEAPISTRQHPNTGVYTPSRFMQTVSDSSSCIVGEKQVHSHHESLPRAGYTSSIETQDHRRAAGSVDTSWHFYPKRKEAHAPIIVDSSRVSGRSERHVTFENNEPFKGDGASTCSLTSIKDNRWNSTHTSKQVDQTHMVQYTRPVWTPSVLVKQSRHGSNRSDRAQLVWIRKPGHGRMEMKSRRKLRPDHFAL